MENKDCTTNENRFKTPVNVFELIALNRVKDTKSDPSDAKVVDEEKVKEKVKTRGEFLFPITMLF